MSETDKQVMQTFEKVLPQMSEMAKEKLLAFGEGMAFMADQQRACAVSIGGQGSA